MKVSDTRPTNSANAVALGLIRTGRARNRSERLGDLIRLGRCAGGFYWLDINGSELRQGPMLLGAEPLQATFVAAMMMMGRG